MGAFQYDNPVMAILARIANMMIVSFLWLLCCLPVVAILPATGALFHTTAKVVRGDGNGVARDFFTSLKGSLKRGIPLTLACGAAGGLLAFALWYGWQLQKSSMFGAVYFTIGCILAFVWVSVVFYLPFALARFEGGPDMYLRMALYFANRNPLKTILRLALLALAALLVDFYPIALLLLPGLYMDLVCGGIEKQLQRFMEENGLAGPEEGEDDGDAPQNGEDPASCAMPSLEMARLYGAPQQDGQEGEGHG